MNNVSSLSDDRHGSYRVLYPEDWQEVRSPYIDTGYKDDSFEITHLMFNDSEVIAKCRMTQYYVSGTDDAGFHLSVFTAIAIVGQLSIIHAHAANDIWRKDYEALLGKLDIEFHRPIRTPDEISMKMRIIDKQLKPSRSKKDLNRAAYTWVYDIEQGAFTGQLKAHFGFRREAALLPG